MRFVHLFPNLCGHKYSVCVGAGFSRVIFVGVGAGGIGAFGAVGVYSTAGGDGSAGDNMFRAKTKTQCKCKYKQHRNYRGGVVVGNVYYSVGGVGVVGGAAAGGDFVGS